MKRDRKKTIMIAWIIVINLALFYYIYNYKSLMSEFDTLKTENLILSVEYQMLKQDFEKTSLKLDDALFKVEEESLREGIHYSPTFSQMKKVLDNDKTEKIKYDEDTFNCVDYSYSLIRGFQEEDIYSCMVVYYLSDGLGHSGVIVNTSDKGLVYIEPQDDKIFYEVEIGDDYCDKVGWRCDDDSWKIESIRHCFGESIHE